MLKQVTLGVVPPDVEAAIKDLLRDDARYTLTEMRSRYRENLVVPVAVHGNDGELVSGFSKNISEAGICIITEHPIVNDMVADLEIYRLSGPEICITSNARWCRPFGQRYYMSGWKFMHLRKGWTAEENE